MGIIPHGLISLTLKKSKSYGEDFKSEIMHVPVSVMLVTCRPNAVNQTGSGLHWVL